MGAVTERLIVGLAAAAKRKRLAAGKVILLALAVVEFDFALNSQGAIVLDSNLDGHRLLTFL